VGVQAYRPTIGRARELMATLESRFWSKVAISTPDECWLWTGAKHRDGRGSVWLGRAEERTVYADDSRVAFYLCRGYWPTMALHLPVDCHNPGCCNPLHIYEGTHSDNRYDAVADGTHYKPMPRKTTPEQERAIFDRYQAGGVSQDQLALEYAISQTTVGRIIRRVSR
jgi:hypothetical protein